MNLLKHHLYLYRCIRRMGEGNVFTGVCLFKGEAGTQSWMGGDTSFLDRVYPSMGYTQPGQYGVPPSQQRMGYTTQPGQVGGLDGVLFSKDFGIPQGKTAERVLATRQAICLLRSRRTFLYKYSFIQGNI